MSTELTEEALQLVSDKAAELSVAVKIENRLEDDHCMMDRDQMKQAILNIALNGIQACIEGGELTVRLTETDDPASMRIENCLPGTENCDSISLFSRSSTYTPGFRRSWLFT